MTIKSKKHSDTSHLLVKLQLKHNETSTINCSYHYRFNSNFNYQLQLPNFNYQLQLSIVLAAIQLFFRRDDKSGRENKTGMKRF